MKEIYSIYYTYSWPSASGRDDDDGQNTVLLLPPPGCPNPVPYKIFAGRTVSNAIYTTSSPSGDRVHPHTPSDQRYLHLHYRGNLHAVLQVYVILNTHNKRATINQANPPQCNLLPNSRRSTKNTGPCYP